MATQADVRRIALSLPGTEETPGHFAFSVPHKGKLKGYVWVWMERLHPRKARVPQPKVVAARVANLVDKDFMLSLNPDKFFTEPHYDGFPAIMVRLPAVTARELKPIITEAWRCMVPKELSTPALAVHFRDRAPNVAATYAALLRAARKLGPVTEDPKKTSIHLVRESAFAGVATQKAALVLTLKSATDIKSPRIRKHERASANRWHLDLRLTEPSDVDAELRRWLAAAYALAG